VTVEEVASETEGDTTIRTWALDPVEHAVERARSDNKPGIQRGHRRDGGRLAAGRAGGFDTAELLDRLRYFADVVERWAGPAEREAFARIDEATGWRERGGRNGGGDDEE